SPIRAGAWSPWGRRATTPLSATCRSGCVPPPCCSAGSSSSRCSSSSPRPSGGASPALPPAHDTGARRARTLPFALQGDRMRFAPRGLLALCAVLCVASAAAQKSSYPTKSIRFVVAFAPGETADVLARAMVPLLAERLRQQVVIENRPGANGSDGIDLVAKAAPDGYTLGLGGSGALATNPSLYAKMPYDPVKNLAPVTSIAHFPFLLVAAP